MSRQRSTTGVDLGWMGAINRAMRWCLFLGIIGFIVAQYVPLIQMNHRLRKTLAQWKETEAAHEATHAANQRRIRDLKDNPVVVERTARELLQLARVGETVVTFVNADGGASAAADPAPSKGGTAGAPSR